MADSEVQHYVQQLIEQTPGLLAIIVSDREGVAVLKKMKSCCSDGWVSPNFVGTYSVVAEKAQKLGLKTNCSMACLFEQHQVVVINRPPVLITLVATIDALTGYLMEIEHELEFILPELRAAVEAV